MSSDPPLFVVGHFEVKARSVGIILFVDNNQKNNYVRFHLNHFKFEYDRKRVDYLEDDHTQLIEDDVNIYGISSCFLYIFVRWGHALISSEVY